MPSRDLVHALDDSRLHSFATGDRALEHMEETLIGKVFFAGNQEHEMPVHVKWVAASSDVSIPKFLNFIPLAKWKSILKAHIN